jgi:hypothetical protein
MANLILFPMLNFKRKSRELIKAILFIVKEEYNKEEILLQALAVLYKNIKRISLN